MEKEITDVLVQVQAVAANLVVVMVLFTPSHSQEEEYQVPIRRPFWGQ